MIVLPPEHLILIPSAAAAVASLLAIVHYGHRKVILWSTTAVLAVALAVPVSIPSYGPYKDISYSLMLPGSTLLNRSWSPGGLLEVVAAPSLRTAPGLSTRYSGHLPKQAALYRDGDRAGTLIVSDGGGTLPDYLQWQTAAAYAIFESIGRVVILGFDGGEEAMRAALNRARRIEIVESDGAAIALFKKIGNLSGAQPGFFDRAQIRITNPRHYLSIDEDGADIVILPLRENLASAVAGFGGASESFLMTAEGIEAALGILGPEGVLAITGWNQAPPTGRVKLMGTLGNVPGFLERTDLSARVRIINGWSTYTILVAPGDLSGRSLEKLQAFCLVRGFDFLQPMDIGYSTGSSRPMESDDEMADLDLRPVTDSRPYPWHTLRVSLMLKTLGSRREELLPRMEWGFLFLIMTLILTLVVAASVLFLTRPRRSPIKSLPSLLYFSCLGLGYMAVEILAIKRGGLLIAQPARAAALVLAPFLLFSGLGSFTAGKVGRGWLGGKWIFPAIAAATVVLYFIIPILIPVSEPLRSVFLVILACPLATMMGLPLPLGLGAGDRLREVSVPWAWAVSGYTSAIGSSLAGVLSVTAGHGSLVVVGICCYLTAWMLLGKLGKID
jgi:hypothetical protein